MRLLPILLFLLITAGGTDAQPRPLDFTFVGPGSLWSPIGLGRYTAGVGITTLVPATRFGKAGLYRGAMDVDNRGHVVAMVDGNGRFGVGLLRVDATGGVQTIRVTVPGVQVADVEVDQDGDFAVLITPGVFTTMHPAAILRVDRTTNLASILVSGVFTPRPLAMTIDRDTGDYIVLDAGHSTGNKILRVARDGSSVSSVISMPAQTWPSISDIEYHPANGALYYSRLSGLHELRPGLPPSTLAIGLLGGRTGSLLVGRSSVVRPRLVGVLASNVTPQSAYTLDLTTGVVSTIVNRIAGSVLSAPRHFFWHRGRNIATVRTGPRAWRINLDFPGEGGRGFVAALSASGTRPGLIAAGRRFALNPDALTALSATGRLTPYLTGNLGVLSASGSAAAVLDLSRLPPLPGLRVWIVAATLDPPAPGGIATVTGPIVLAP